MQIYELIPKVMKDIGAVAKSQKNEAQKYMFRGIDAFYQAAHPAMVAHGVFCAPSVLEREEYRFEKVNDYGKTSVWLHVTLKVQHRFYAPDGSFVDVVTVGEGLDNSDKSSNKCMSAAMKYALIELFCVPTQDIEDSDRTTPEAGLKQPIVLTPKAAPEPPAIAPEVSVSDEFQPEYISVHEKSNLSKRFRESLKPELEPDAQRYRHDALIAIHDSGLFRSKLVDKDGNPTQDYILKSEYSLIGKELVKAAKSL